MPETKATASAHGIRRRLPRSIPTETARGKRTHLGPVIQNNGRKAVPLMGQQTLGAVFHAVLQIGEVSRALRTQGIQWAIAEQAVKALRIQSLMAGKIGALPIGEEGSVVDVLD